MEDKAKIVGGHRNVLDKSVVLNLPLSAGAPVLDVPWADAIVADTGQGKHRLNRYL